MVQANESTIMRLQRAFMADDRETPKEEINVQIEGARYLARMLGVPPLLATYVAVGVRIGAILQITPSMLERLEFESRAPVEGPAKEE